MKKDTAQLLEDVLEIAERIASVKISDGMKDTIIKSFVKRLLAEKHREGDETRNNDDSETNGANEHDFPFPSIIKRYLRTYKVTEDQIANVFHLEPDNVDYLVAELKVKNNTEGIHHCILLVGLRNALESNTCKVVINEVRELAGNIGVYDSTNFSYHMKQNAALLKSYKAGKDSELSGAGVKAAMALVKVLAGE